MRAICACPEIVGGHLTDARQRGPRGTATCRSAPLWSHSSRPQRSVRRSRRAAKKTGRHHTGRLYYGNVRVGTVSPIRRTERTVMGGVFEAAGLLRASSAEALQVFLRRQHGVEDAEANPVSQTVTVHYDEALLTANDVRALIGRFGCTCG